MSAVSVRTGTTSDREWVIHAARRQLGSSHQVHSRRQFHVDAHDLLIAEVDGDPAGFLTWIIEGDECEVLAIASDRRRAGVGAALLNAIEVIARDRDCRRIHLTTTDANVATARELSAAEQDDVAVRAAHYLDVFDYKAFRRQLA